MSPGDFQRVETIFTEALEQPTDHRTAFVVARCGDDAELREEVLSLLEAHLSAGGFLPTPPAADQPTAVGQMAGPYKLLRRIAEGGMGEVYLAVRADDEYKKRVAIKVIRDSSDRGQVVRRFRTERQILAGLDHPNIARLLDGGTLEDGRPYFAIDYIEGVPIDVYCDRERLPIDRRLELFRTVCSAVHFAHTNLVVHRDIKPSNILVSTDGIPKLLDFGIAKLLKPDQFAGDVEITRTRHQPMTPRWASPEQVAGRAVTTASDVYSLGVLLYKLLTGRLPFEDETQRSAEELRRLIAETEPERPSESLQVDDVEKAHARALTPGQLRRRLSGDLDNIVMMALRKEVHRRYASVEQLSEDIDRYLDELPVRARPDTMSYRVGKFTRRNAWPVAATATIALMIAGSAVFFAVQSSRVAEERDEARRERDRAETVLSLMERVFEVADPGEAAGAQLTAREILRRGARQVRQELADQPEARASLLRSIGNVERNLGAYDVSRELLEEALATRRELFDERSLPVAESLHDLGQTRRDAGDFEEADEALRAALDIRTELDGPEGPLTLETELALGQLLKERGAYAASAEVLTHVIEAHEKSGKLTETLAAAKSYLAIAASEQGDLERGEAIFREVVELRRRLHTGDHPSLADALNDLGVVCGIQGKLGESKRFLTEALEQRRRLLDTDHPLMAESLNNLGRVHRELGEAEQAERYFREAVEIYRARLGPSSPQAAAGLANLASLKIGTGELEQAEAFARQALAMRRETLEPRSYYVGSSLSVLGELLVDRGEVAEASTLLEEAIDVLSEAVSPEHWRTGNARRHLARCRAAQGRPDEAEALFRTGIEQIEAMLPADHNLAIEARANFADFLRSRGRNAEARALLGDSGSG